MAVLGLDIQISLAFHRTAVQRFSRFGARSKLIQTLYFRELKQVCS